jgi:hypothetical protein
MFSSKRISASQPELIMGVHTNFFKRLLTSFREHQEYLNTHSDAENTKDNIGLPLDILEGGWNEEREGKIKCPCQLSTEDAGLMYSWWQRKARLPLHDI